MAFQLSEPQSSRKSVVYTGGEDEVGKEFNLRIFLNWNMSLETLEMLVSSIPNQVKDVYNSRGIM